MLRILLFILLAIGVTAISYSQSAPKPYPNDIAKQRLLAIAVGGQLYTYLQGDLDLDSTVLLACKAYGFSRLFPYNEGYSDGSPLPGSDLIDKGKLDQAIALGNSLKGEKQLAVWVQLAGFYLFKPGMNKKDLDKAFIFIEKARQLSIPKQFEKWQTESLNLLAIYHYQTMNLPESQKYFSQVTNYYRKNGNQARLALALGNQGSYLPFGHPQKLPFLEESRAIFRKLNLKEKEIEMLGKILTEHFMTGWDRAEKELVELIGLEKQIGFRHIHIPQQALAFIATQKSDYMTEFSYANQAVRNMQATRDYAFSSIYYNTLAIASYTIGNLKGGLYWLKRGMNDNMANGNPNLWYKSFLMLLAHYTDQRQSREVLDLIERTIYKYPPTTPSDAMMIHFYQGLASERSGQTEKAKTYYAQAEAIASKMPVQHVHALIPNIYTTIADFYLTLGNKERSRYFLSKAEAIPVGKKGVSHMYSVTRLRYRIDSAAGDYPSAIANLWQHKKFSDSLMGVSMKKQMNQLMVQYETAQKDQNIKLLTQKAQLQQSQIQRAETVRNMTFGGIALLLVIVGLGYNQYRIKQRSNEQLMLQQMEINRKNAALEQLVNEKDDLLGEKDNLLDEKEWLLKEIHHRVKNNLHTIMSLLESQSSYLEDDALNAVRDSQHRVHAMSLIHQKLYLAENVTTINMQKYIEELVTYLRSSFQTTQQVYFNLQIQPIELDIAQAIPLGLILNEAITNALKYAFPGNREGEVSISFSQPAALRFLLEVTDNGIGIPGDFDIDNSGSLGMQLMQGLCRELNGQFMLNTNGGTSISISFAIEPVYRSQRAAQES